MLPFVLLVSTLLAVGAIAYVFRLARVHARRKALLEYGKTGEIQSLTRWIEAGAPHARLFDLMDYFRDIDREDLLLEIYESFPFDAFPEKHIRLYASQAYRRADRGKEALDLAEALFEADPTDDTHLENLIEVLITFGDYDRARQLLTPRLERKYEGTMFARHRARLLAHDGDYEKAVKAMEKIVKRDFNMYSNTIAQPQKRMLRQQYGESRELLAEYRQALDPESMPDETDRTAEPAAGDA